jgi:hypothetical protein
MKPKKIFSSALKEELVGKLKPEYEIDCKTLGPALYNFLP